MNLLVAQAVGRVLHHLDRSLPQPPDVFARDLEFLLFRCGLATGVRPVVNIAAILELAAS